MRRAFAIAVTLAALASCDAFEGSNGATGPSGDGGPDATTPAADGSALPDDAHAPSDDAGVAPDGGDAGAFCADENLKGRSTLACEDFEGTDASHGFAQEALAPLHATIAPVMLGRAPNGLIASGSYAGSTTVAGVVYSSSLVPTADFRLRFMLQMRDLSDAADASAAHVQAATIQLGGAGWALKFHRDGFATNFYTTLGNVKIEEAVRSLVTTYEIWLDVVHVETSGLTAQVYVDRTPIGGPQFIPQPVSTNWTVRVGALLDDAQDRVSVAIDDVLLQEL